MHRWSKYVLNSESIGLYEQIFENLVVVDAHAHIGKDKDMHRMGPEKFIKQMNTSRVDKAIVFPLNDPRDNQNFIIPNDIIYKAYKKYPERLIPFFRLNPHTHWKEETEKRISQGFKGVKLHPRSQEFGLTFSKAMKIYEKAQDENLTVLVHTGFGLGNISAQIKEITDTFPKLKLILGHSAFVDMENTIKKVGNKENVLFETSTVKIFDLFELLERVDYHKIAFGSDLPYYDIDLALEMVIDSAVILKKTPHQIKHILGLNIMKWFK